MPFALEAMGQILVATTEGLLSSALSPEAASGEQPLAACCLVHPEVLGINADCAGFAGWMK